MMTSACLGEAAAEILTRKGEQQARIDLAAGLVCALAPAELSGPYAVLWVSGYVAEINRLRVKGAA